MPENIRKLIEQANQLYREQKWDKAIGAYSRILKLEKRNPSIPSEYKALIYCMLGVLYGITEKMEKAIFHFDESIRLSPNYAASYRGIGYVYWLDEEHEKSIKAYKKANEIDSSFVSKDRCSYIAAQNFSKDTILNLFKIDYVVTKIKEVLIYKPSENTKIIAHYANLNTLKKLARKEPEPFHCYNADYVNDPEEGKLLLEELVKLGLLNDAGETKKFLSRNSPAYLGSFVKTETEDENKNGKLILWRTYGKHEEKETSGACLHFDISQFSNIPNEQLIDMVQLENKNSNDLDPVPFETKKPCLYSVAYESNIKRKRTSYSLEKISNISDEKYTDSNTHEQLNPWIKKLLKKLAKALNSIGGSGWEEDNSAHQLARAMLNEIRFLFKADHYLGEEELRIVNIHSPNSVQEVKVNDDLSPPRFIWKFLPTFFR